MAVSDSEKDSPPLWGMGVVGAAIVVRFMHSLAQKELSLMVMDDHPSLSPSPALFTLLLACLQVAAAVAVFKVTGLSFSLSSTSREAAITGLLGYLGGLFLLNYLLWGEGSAASACYGVQEPLFCILLLYLTASISTESHRVTAVACLCMGAALLTSRFTLMPDTRALLRMLASVCLMVRNVVTKHLYDNNVGFTLRPQNTVVTVVVCASVGGVVVGMMMSSGLVVASLLAVVTGVLSVTLLHLVLTLLSLNDAVTVAVFMLWAQVLENVIVQTEVPRPGMLGMMVGAVLFAAGHYAYFNEGLQSGTVHLNIKKVGVNEMLTRLQFVLYAGGVVGLTATLLQPTISERDLNALSYVGLDRIARRLLNVHPRHHHH